LTWQTRLVVPVGTRAFLRIYWDGCSNSYGYGGAGVHHALVFLAESRRYQDWTLGGKSEDHPESAWPTTCASCGAKAIQPTRQVFHRILYETQDGTKKIRDEFEPGDMYIADWYPCFDGGSCLYGWTNCDGKHLIVILPSKHHHPWDID
jgi:hypothetical protein